MRVATSLCSLAVLAGLALATPAHAAAPSCATTAAADAPAEPAAGTPCWVDVAPYPFGADGLPVDPSSRTCPGRQEPNDYNGYNPDCYLRVSSLAFRSWNRGLASLVSSRPSGTTAFGVWLFNGSRWYPDPSFPGRGVCNGDTILWAGKLDHWLVGDPGNGSRLCRYDGTTYAWESLQLPAETRAKVAGARIIAGSCFAWNDCWFFGQYGVRVHWDGSLLLDAGTPSLDDLWSRSRITAATARTLSDGRQAGVAAAWTSGLDARNGGTLLGDQVPPFPDGQAPPQLFGSEGGAFAPLPFSPPTLPRDGDPWRTDLVAVALDEHGRGWVAGNPVGSTVNLAVEPRPGNRVSGDPQPAPLVPFALAGRTPCTAPDPAFQFQFALSGRPNGRDAYAWSALSVFPGSGAALAGGTLRPRAAGETRHDDGRAEPALTTVACDGSAETVRFREPDPTAGEPGIVAANYGGVVTAVAANAANDAWAATATEDSGGIEGPLVGGTPARYFQRPHLYQLTDGARPAAPPGDDREERPIDLMELPPIIEEEEPEPEPEPAPAPPPEVIPAPPTPASVRRLPDIYAIKKLKKPTHVRGNRYRMVIRFRVRRTVTVGVQGLRGKRVVARSGLKRLRPGARHLTLQINRKRWPKRIRFYTRNGSTR